MTLLAHAGRQCHLILSFFFLLATVSNAEKGSPLNDIQEGFNNFSDDIQDKFDGVMDSVEEVLDRSTLAGQITPLFQKFVVSREQLQAIWNTISEVVTLSDLIFLIVLGWALVPALEVPFERFGGGKGNFRRSKTYHGVASLSQVAQLALVVYMFDMIKIFLLGAGFQIPRGERLTHAFCYIVYIIWAATRLSKFKEFIVSEMTRETQGRVQVVNRVGDFLLFVCAAFLILDILNMEMGLAMRGVVAFGSVGTLVFSLASKDIISNLLQGVLLSASDRIYEGDSIQLQKSGYSGKVESLGWLETIIRGSDEILVTIPNQDLLSQRVCNLSRIHQSQVKQVLRFPYSESEKLQQLTQDIKTEIRTSCPAVITDGTRPFRCYWTNYEHDHLEVILVSHFRIKPVGEDYHENKQRVLHAINRAVKKNNMDFHNPS